MDLLIKNNMKISGDKIIEAIQDEKVICWSDLLVKLDLIPIFRKYQEEHKKQYSIQKVFMGKTLMNWIDEIFKVRVIKAKDKRVKHLKERYRLTEYGMDCLQSMPVEAKEDIDYMLLEDIN